MQKGVFLCEMRGPDAWKHLYTFRPYDWGPYSSQLQSDVRDLMADERMDHEAWPYRRYGSYSTTVTGDAEIDAIVEAMPPAHRDFIRNVRRFVMTRSFRKLLTDVYAEYPEYAVNSRFS